jgi:hypothetical protein
VPPKAEIRLEAFGERQVAGAFGKVDRSINRTGSTSRRVSAGMRREWGTVRRSAGGLLKVLGGVGLAAGGKRVMDFRQRLGQLQADAGMTTGAAEKLATKILGLQTAFNVSKDSITDAVQVFQDFGGIVPKGVTILAGLTKISKASGTEMKDLATIASTLMQTLGMSPDEALQMVTLLNDQALKGQVALRDLAKVIPGVMGAGVGKGFGGERAVKQLGTLMQVAGQAVGGNAEVARTQALALMRDLTKAAPTLQKKFGISVFDKDRNMRDINDIMAAVIKGTGGKMGIALKGGGFKEFFTEESAKVAGVFKSMFDVGTGKFKTESTVANVLGAKGGMATVEAQLQRRVGGIAKEAEEFETSLKQLDEAVQKYGARLIQWASANKAEAAATGLGLAAAVKLGPSILRWASKIKLGKGRGGGPAGTDLGGVGGLLPGGGVQPVFVVNMPGANIGQAAGYFGPGGGALAGAGPEAPKTGGKLARVGKMAGTAAAGLSAIAAAGAAGWQLGKMLDSAFDLSTKLANAGQGLASYLTGGRDPYSMAQKAAAKRVAAHEVAVKESTVTRQAQQLAAMQAKGVKSVEVGKGQRVALTAENISMILARTAKRQGMGEEQFAKLIGQIDASLKNLKITVKPADGLDKIKVETDRGPKQ